MATFTENFDFDFLRQIYDIREVNSLAEFLLPRTISLHHPRAGMAGVSEKVSSNRTGGRFLSTRLVYSTCSD